MIPPWVEREDPPTWNCSMNVHDPARSSCEAKELTSREYLAVFDQAAKKVIERNNNDEDVAAPEEDGVEGQDDSIMKQVLASPALTKLISKRSAHNDMFQREEEEDSKKMSAADIEAAMKQLEADEAAARQQAEAAAVARAMAYTAGGGQQVAAQPHNGAGNAGGGQQVAAQRASGASTAAVALNREAMELQRRVGVEMVGLGQRVDVMSKQAMQ
jgi:hypothetical protein